jgi:gamma-glutamylcyclotransferase (GGCT)/AIG2-like uncharacterized protein YtfP
MKTINPSEPARAINRAIVMAAALGSDDSDLQPAELVFVYGTLKRGQNNHHHLAGSPCCGEARLVGLALHDLGPFPMAITSLDPTAVVCGELYGVPAERLEQLDRFEGVPRLYQRQRWPLADGRQAWVYLGRSHQVRHAPRLADGSWCGARRAKGAGPSPT